MVNLILASNSPRRKELFSLFGWPFEVKPADIIEGPSLDESPVAYVMRLAYEKGRAIAETQDGLVIAADTIVVDGDVFLGKPEDEADARRILTQLRGRTHQVYTGMAIVNAATGDCFTAVCRTDVPMRDYTDDEIDAYLITGDPMDKAGAYGIQHVGFHPVTELRGCYASVMGLPLCHLSLGLRQFGQEIPVALPQRCQTLLNYDCPVWAQILGQV